MNMAHKGLSTEVVDHFRRDSGDSAIDFVLKLEPPWFETEEPPDPPSPVNSRIQHVAVSSSESLLTLCRSHVCHLCSASFVLLNSLEIHLASVHGETLQAALPVSSTPEGDDASSFSHTIREMVSILGDWKPVEKRKDILDYDDADRRDDKKNNRKHVCNVCNMAFIRAYDLKTHKIIHTGERPYKCLYCDADFNISSNLKRHVKRIHTGNKPHVCDVCGLFFFHTSSLTKHKKIHTECDDFHNTGREEVSDLGDRKIEESMKDKMDNSQIGKKDEMKKSRQHVCHVCSMAFHRAYDLKMHMIVHTGERPYKCPFCGSDFNTSSNMKRHVKRIHSGNRPHVCDVCGSGFFYTSSLVKHKMTHADAGDINNTSREKVTNLVDRKIVERLKEKLENSVVDKRDEKKDSRQHMCKVCSTAFMTSYDLKMHKIIHTGQRPYKCLYCDSDFSISSNLKRHIKRLHTGNTAHVCDVCGLAFYHTSSLTKHRRIHTDAGDFNSREEDSYVAHRKPVEKMKEEPNNSDVDKTSEMKKTRQHVCNLCSKAFARAYDLKMHKIIHTGQRPYKCLYCDFTFNISSNLKRHVRRIHTGNRQHVCDVCGMAFFHTSSLSKHMRIHTGEEPFTCSVCEMTFSAACNLKLHKRVHTCEKAL